MHSFPYKRLFLTDTPSEYFQRAQTYVPRVINKKISDWSSFSGLYNIHSMTSKNDFLKHFPLSFLPDKNRNVALIITNESSNYNAIDVLPDYFTEYARINDTGAFESISPYEYWIKHHKEIQLRFPGSLYNQREYLWKHGPKEARQGKITNYLSLFEILDSRIVLDPSAAWGDRLIAALASVSVTAYTGVDPHSKLPIGWQEILNTLGPISGKDMRNFTMINEPFEIPTGSSTELLPFEGEYDTILISTAPLIGDKYDEGNPNQAVAKYGSSLKSYIEGFIIPYLTKCIQVLKDDGYICMTVLDRIKTKYFITELELLLIESLEDNVMKYEGVIWWQGDSGNLVPWWIFKKNKQQKSRERLEETMRLLKPYDLLLH